MRSRWLWPALFGVALLIATSASGFVLYRRAAAILQQELDERLLAFARAASVVSTGEGPGRSEALERLRSAGRLENVFVMDESARSVADARTGVSSGQRYTMLDYDPLLAERARGGQEVVARTTEIEGVPLQTAYVPGSSSRVVVVVASPAFVEPMRALRGLPVLAAVLGFVSALAFSLALVAARRALDRSAEGAMRMERLALAGRLAAQVAHEIRNPLAIVRGSVQLAERAARSGANPLPHLSDLLEEVDRVNALVDDFLSLSKEVALRRTQCDLNAVADRTAAFVEAGVKRKLGRSHGEEPVVVLADEQRLRQALLALVMNAIESSPAAEVEIRTGRSAVGAYLEVYDDGPGMTPDVLARAGDPFFTTKPTGTGLGLPVVRQIAHAHGAELVLTSRPGEGTSARIVFPR